jgi:hypothetical protein
VSEITGGLDLRPGHTDVKFPWMIEPCNPWPRVTPAAVYHLLTEDERISLIARFWGARPELLERMLLEIWSKRARSVPGQDDT